MGHPIKFNYISTFFSDPQYKWVEKIKYFCNGYEFTGLEKKNNINGHDKLRTLTKNKRCPNWNNIKSSVIIFFFLILKVKNLNLNEDSFASSFFSYA